MEYEGENFELTEHQIQKAIKAFNYLDKKKKGLLKFELLGDLLRCCGYNVSFKEIEDIKNKIIENKKININKKNDENQENNIENQKRENNIENEKQIENEIKKKDSINDEKNISELLDNLKNYDNYMEIEKKKELLKKQEEENQNLFTIKEYFRIIQIPNITKEIKPTAVLTSFENFDEKGNGKISIKKLRFILQYLGEPLTNDEFDEFYNWMLTVKSAYKGDYIFYEDIYNELVNIDSNI